MDVRALHDQDYSALLELLKLHDDNPEYRVMAPEGRSEEELSLELSATDAFNEIFPLVLEQDGQVLAYVSLCRYEGETFLEGPLLSEAITPEEVQPLLERVIAEAGVREVNFLEAFVEEPNERAQEALRLAGFSAFRTTYIYEITRDEAPALPQRDDVDFHFTEDIDAAAYRELYRDSNDAWATRLAWTDEELEARFMDPRVQLLLALQDGKPVGHLELEFLDDGIAEISYFGVLPEARGQEIGKWLIMHGLKRAFGNSDLELVLARAHDDERAACHTIEEVGFRLAHGTIAFTLELTPASA
jgi:RimJ/RimL family protein N-acetyltransferase